MARKPPIRHDAIVTAFADKLRQIRRSRGMTQRALARVAHVTESYISRLENGAIAPGIDLVARLARALGTQSGELLPSAEVPDDISRGGASQQAKRLSGSAMRSN